MLGITLCQLVLDLAPSAVSHSVILLAEKNKLSSLPEGALPGYRPDPRVTAGPLLLPLWLVFPYLLR